METEYDEKFEEMKKYIPFLESMIKRLESTSQKATNPRQAQLDKIRSLRDLLLNKKKRMKMENLLKCEQVLVNLYAKVEQREAKSSAQKAPDPGFSIHPPTPQEKSDLQAVRNKLKTVAKRQEEVQDTLPEILRVNEVEEVHTAGSKEPALFQRRPNKASLSPTRTSPKTSAEEKLSPSSASKRSYTRVLVSPESRARRWSPTVATEENPLFSRRSPRRSPRRYSPSYHKKERKKSSKESRKSKDLNITLNVPEDSLSTLNTKDIFTRIINCRDGDVDIDTLRELRKQILTELQKTGARDDISDLILKSYKKKKKRIPKKEEVEEGELSDSESEVIENIYGNLVLKDQNETKTLSDKNKARKIQICLVINSDNAAIPDGSTEEIKKSNLELEMYNEEGKEDTKINPIGESIEPKSVNDGDNKTISTKHTKNDFVDKTIISTHKEDIKTNTCKEDTPEVITIIDDDDKNSESTKTDKMSKENESTPKLQSKSVEENIPQEPVQFKANFYKPMIENVDKQSKENEQTQEAESKSETKDKVTSITSNNVCSIEAELEKMEKTTEIPLLNEPTVHKRPTNNTVSEIDILQALKNEILSETITIPGSEATPLLHQPKIIKVASAKEIMPKKRISIEKYKAKAVSSSKCHSDEHVSSKDDHTKKPSLKLTEKECERFNIPKIAFDDDSSEDDVSEIASDIYSDLVPKSPDNDDSLNVGSLTPVIIPADPVKVVPVIHKVDVDMRTLPILSPNNNALTLFSNVSLSAIQEIPMDKKKSDSKIDQSKSLNRSLLDPRVRRDSNAPASPHTGNADRTPRSLFSNNTQSPASNTIMTPNSRLYEMTPSQQSFDNDQSNKHVYVPTFSGFECKDRENSVSKEARRENIEQPTERRSRIDDIGDASWSSSDVSQSTRYSDSFTNDKNKGHRNERYNIDNRDSYSYKRSECPQTPVPSFGRSDLPTTSTQPFGRLDKPMTPQHSFSRSDCPSTPSHSFGRGDCPTTPSHPFGRLDSSSTPNQPFGSHTFNLSECPLTPSHSFGASECPPTPTHLFGRSDCPPTPSQPFGRSETSTNLFGRSDSNTQKYIKDPRINRKPEYDAKPQFDDRDRGYCKDGVYYRGGSYKGKYRYYALDQNRHPKNNLQRNEYRSGASMSKESENEQSYTTRERYRNERGYEDFRSRRGNQRESIVSRPDDRREKSISRNMRNEDNFTQSSSGTHSVCKNASIEPEIKTLSVQSHAGRSFTIDTSVNATFQSFLDSGKGSQVFENNFDARRQRAASVGRSLVHPSKKERMYSNESKPKIEINRKREVFRRASSVGREHITTEKRSFQEIKADFESYRFPANAFGKFDTGKIRNIDTKSKNSTESLCRSRKDIHEKQQEEKRGPDSFQFKDKYSPRNNNRDPRMRKDYDSRNRYDKYGGDAARSRKSGIVYSNDNIVKGVILTSGYGVKNYKIPKIKRVVLENEVEPGKNDQSTIKKDEKEKGKEKIADKIKESGTLKEQEYNKNKVKEAFKHKNTTEVSEKVKDTLKEINKEKCKDKVTVSDTETEQGLQIKDNILDEQIGRRLTRSSRKSLLQAKSETTTVAKPKKVKRQVIIDSDSDTEKDAVNTLIDSKNLEKLKSPSKERKYCKKPSAVDIDTNFGLEELEMFSDNVVSDPVIDNINALIADLDNDLDRTKNESSNNFTKEITLENMMLNISSPHEHSSDRTGEEYSKVFQTVSKSSNMSDDKLEKVSITELSDQNKNSDNVVLGSTKVVEYCDSKELNISKSGDAEQVETSNLENISQLNKPNEDIVSTSETGTEIILKEDILTIDEQNIDGCSTPDSTFNTDDILDQPKIEEGLTSSTDELHNETNVTSTDSAEPQPSSSRLEAPGLDSMGSLLSILQNKAKIKEFLSMLGDQAGNNDKIKKKLEKLSEIVSDDESDEKPEENLSTKTGDTSNDTLRDTNETVKKSDVSNEEKQLIIEFDEADENDSNSKDLEDEKNEQNFDASVHLPESKSKKKMPVKKGKFSRKGKGRFAKKGASVAQKRVTRATAAVDTKPKQKKTPRELLKLHEDIKEMFIKEDILSSTTGIRMCRLAKLVDEKVPAKEEIVLPEAEPVVVLEKFKNTVDRSRELLVSEKVRRKPGPKPKPKISTENVPEIQKEDKSFKYKPGPKSKTKIKRTSDPYVFDTESVGDTTTEKASDDETDNSSESELSSLTSSKSFGSSELLADLKKKNKRKRRGWQDGVIKPKHKKKKVESKVESPPEKAVESIPLAENPFSIMPDMNCFTDIDYCFRKNELKYSCRLCAFTGADIVHHYKNEHPHVEIPLSRMAPQIAEEAIEQCKGINFEAVSNIFPAKYVCIFCYKEFINSNSVLETFFWHVVSMHTGEYKHKCTECLNESPCPFSWDIPPPPKDTKGQLVGYICKKCNFTQLSLENLKTHVIVRHNDEQTAVYTINLAVMSRKVLKEFLRRSVETELLTAKDSNCPQEIITKTSSNKPSITKESITPVGETGVTLRKPASVLTTIQSKITFEADDTVSEMSDMTNEEPCESTIKIERCDTDIMNEIQSAGGSEYNRPPDAQEQQPNQSPCLAVQQPTLPAVEEGSATQASDDIVDYPHFKINITESGAKEYICCINMNDNHFKTTLLISMKKHVQLKHSENWDGYCFVCKVIVTPQGAHLFKDCFQHYLDKHMDNFPIFRKEDVAPAQASPTWSPAHPKPYINVRPLSELIPSVVDGTPKDSTGFPIIQSVISLGVQSTELSRSSPTYPTVRQDDIPPETVFKYEEAQAEVKSKKHCVVLETMMSPDKLIQVYKCAGRFCSFTTDSAEDALLHASTHQRIGGVDALKCSYCSFDAMGNAIDLVMHVFKEHGHCTFCCGQCFYRAAASQSVGVHMSRVHGVAISRATVLRTTAVSSNPAVNTMLTREQAVPYYVCKHGESDDVCKFRTYTPDKFCEHLQQRHVDAACHPCYLCSTEASSPADLVKHMKLHGLKLYQCTWCVFGGDNESELLTHISVLHPTKQPQAYVRIITNKEGSNELRVLPLAFLNKQKVPTEDVTPNTIRDNPAREAERSLDLEKLIGLTLNLIAEPVNEPPEERMDTSEIIPEDNLQQPIAAQLETAVVAPVVTPAIIGSTRTSMENIGDQLNAPPSASNITVNPPSIAPLVKSEALDKPKQLTSDIVVLDSDDDDPIPAVIDLSDEEQTAITKNKNMKLKVPAEKLNVCPKCRQLCKTLNGLKKHMNYCYRNKDETSICPHCPFKASIKQEILLHYTNDHGDKNIYQCGVCQIQLSSLALIKRHLKFFHKEKNILTTSAILDSGISCYTVHALGKEKKELPNTKVTATVTSEKEPTKTNTRLRYRPDNVHMLPVTPILDHLVYCELCEFSSKVRLNMVRHMQFHADQQPAPQTAPVNPVPHLETNEKHFDKMVNLASSSKLQTPKVPDRSRIDKSIYIGNYMPADKALRYPKQVSARQRNTCGALDCTYTSVDVDMLKRHWETLHAEETGFRCVHCPNSQTLDTTRPLTANRILTHLKMHDGTLYACSDCSYYHFKRSYVERHLLTVHPTATLMIVREEAKVLKGIAAKRMTTADPPASVPPAPTAAPTMDLKPWQCGLCQYKSMLRPEVVEHCFKFHQSKMQYRCAYCPYRASAVENVNNHLAHSHANEPVEVIHYYYREGDLPDEPDGTARWMKQRQLIPIVACEIKTEAQRSPTRTPETSPVTIDLNLVKAEVMDEVSPGAVETIEELCKRFGQFCEPNGIKYKCSLCNAVTEDTREAMQSHLYEELKYRKWGCSLCTYKAFHKEGLSEHMTAEHRRQCEHIQLPTNNNIEKWVAAHLNHQAAIIDNHKTNLAKQKIITERVTAGPSTAPPPPTDLNRLYSVTDLEIAFGQFGTPRNMMYCCPKCGTFLKDEDTIKDHLEMELNKIRWSCSMCPNKFQTYHEAQYHCKGHVLPSTPKEAIRDPVMRAAWVTNALQAQREQMQSAAATPPTSVSTMPEKPETDNSLLLVRYEERIPTPDHGSPSSTRPAEESDDERLVIDEHIIPKRRNFKNCTYCPFKTKYHNAWREHVLKHFNLKPYTCFYCPFSSYRQSVVNHTDRLHPGEPLRLTVTQIPADVSTPGANQFKKKPVDDDPPKLICLHCEKSLPEDEIGTHMHDTIKPDFAKKGDVVVKCCICLVLRLDVNSLQAHHNTAHPMTPINYALFKLHYDTRETHLCSHCHKGFKYLRDLKSHHNAAHSGFQLKYVTTAYTPMRDEDNKNKDDTPVQPPVKRIARKSTTKLPGCKSVAKKSTTKLPYSDPDSSSDEEYSYYNTRPEPLETYANVTTLMSFCNTMMPFTLKKLREIINIEPKVLVTDFKVKHSRDNTLQ